MSNKLSVSIGVARNCRFEWELSSEITPICVVHDLLFVEFNGHSEIPISSSVAVRPSSAGQLRKVRELGVLQGCHRLPVSVPGPQRIGPPRTTTFAQLSKTNPPCQPILTKSVG